jgi:hypothetical protein
MVIRRPFLSKRMKHHILASGCLQRKLCNEETSIIRIIRHGIVRWAGHVARIRKKRN